MSEATETFWNMKEVGARFGMSSRKIKVRLLGLHKLRGDVLVNINRHWYTTESALRAAMPHAFEPVPEDERKCHALEREIKTLNDSLLAVRKRLYAQNLRIEQLQGKAPYRQDSTDVDDEG